MTQSWIHRGWLIGALWIASWAAFANAGANGNGNGHAQYEGRTVASVGIEGLDAGRARTVAAALQTQPGQPYAALDVRKDILTLSNLARTVSVHADVDADDTLAVRFVLTPFPRLGRMQVLGAQKVKPARVRQLAGLSGGDVVDDHVVSSLRRALRRAYTEAGLPSARIEITLIDREGGADGAPVADLQVLIDEGRRVLCDDLVIEGHRAFSTARLRLVVETAGSWWFFKNTYDEETFEADLTALRDFYAARGYFDARVERGLFRERTRNGRAMVSPVIRIREGKRYRLGRTTVRGVKLFAQSRAEAPFRKLSGDPFDARDFDAALRELQNLYYDDGFLTTELATDYEYQTESAFLNPTITVTEGERIYLDKVRLDRGPTLIDEERSWFGGLYDRVAQPADDETVLREILIEPGEVYSKKKERASLRRLRRLGVFEEKSLAIYNEPTGEPGLQDMVVRAREGRTGHVRVGVGYGDAPGAFIFGSVHERNVGGEANVFDLSGVLGTRDSSFSIGYKERYLGRTRNSLATRLYYLNQTRPGYKAHVGGLTSLFAHPIGDSDWTLDTTGRFEWVRLRERDHIDAEEDLDDSYGVATLRLRALEDTLEPGRRVGKRGHRQSFGIEGGYAGGGLVRFKAARDQYWPLTDWLTWRLQAKAGLMPFDAGHVPIHERFFLGGNEDLRGFRYRGAGDHDRRDDDVPIGGAAKVLVRNEMMFPIYDQISGVVFLDAGALGRSPSDWSTPRASAGAGVRFDIEQVQIAIDAALPFLKQSEDQTRYVHFSIRSSF